MTDDSSWFDSALAEARASGDRDFILRTAHMVEHGEADALRIARLAFVMGTRSEAQLRVILKRAVAGHATRPEFEILMGLVWKALRSLLSHDSAD